jgi:solute carrier family 25 2-oxodicarboxylate transporter 21
MKMENMTRQASNSNNATPLPFRYQFAAVAVSGISEIFGDVRDTGHMSTTTAKNVETNPLDVVKTQIQLQHGKIMDDGGYNGVSDCFRNIFGMKESQEY